MYACERAAPGGQGLSHGLLFSRAHINTARGVAPMAEVDLKEKFPNMTPIKSAPSLSTINGIGFRLYGSRDADAYTGTHVATWCFTILYLPVLMLRAYRVAQGANGKWYFIGREPLSRLARNWNKLLLTAVLATTAGVSYHLYTSTPAYQAKRQMASAAKHTSA